MTCFGLESKHPHWILDSVADSGFSFCSNLLVFTSVFTFLVSFQNP